MAKNVKKPPPIIHARLAIDRDVLDVAEAHACFTQTELDRFGRQTGPMFDAPEPFLLRCRHQRTIAHQASRRIPVICVKTESYQCQKLKR